MEVVGYVNLDVPFFGKKKIVDISGSLTRGTWQSFDLSLVSGKVGVTCENGHEIWIHVNVSSTFGSFTKDDRLA